MVPPIVMLVCELLNPRMLVLVTGCKLVSRLSMLLTLYEHPLSIVNRFLGYWLLVDVVVEVNASNDT